MKAPACTVRPGIGPLLGSIGGAAAGLLPRPLRGAVVGLGLWCAATVVLATVEVNAASLAELEALRGIGTAVAARVVDARREGAFRDWRDLLARVKGLGPASAARLSTEGLVVNGAAYPGLASATAASTPR